MKYKHALFLNPYTPSDSTRDIIRGMFPPTGLEYVAASAEGLTDKLTLIDLRYEKDLTDTGELLDFIKTGIDIVCVSIGWDRQYNEICGLLNRMPDGVPLVVGGYKATEAVEDLFKLCPKIKIVVRGEGEDTIKEIFRDTPLANIRGISYRDGGRVVHNANRPLPDVNTIRPPDRALRRNSYQMRLSETSVTSLKFDAVLSARGCPYNCKFCTFSMNPLGQKRTYAARSAKSVVDEIEEMTANVILFSDDNFITSVKRAEEICDLIIARKIRKRFIAQVRIDLAGHSMLLEKMVKAGFKILLIGVESPHDRILAQLNKGFDSATVRKSFAVLRKHPIYYHGYFIYGNVGETEEEMLYIPKFAKEIGLDSITYSKLRIEKFSPLRKTVEETPGYHITPQGAVYSDKCNQDTLVNIGKRIKFSFYTPVRILKISMKCLAIRCFTFGEILSFILAGPVLLGRVVVNQVRKGQLGDSLKRIFIHNA